MTKIRDNHWDIYIPIGTVVKVAEITGMIDSWMIGGYDNAIQTRTDIPMKFTGVLVADSPRRNAPSEEIYLGIIFKGKILRLLVNKNDIVKLPQIQHHS